MPRKTSIYLPDDLDAAIRASGRSIPDLIRLGLEARERPRSDRLAGAVEELTAALASGYRLVPPADDASALAAELAALAERMNKLVRQIGA